MNYFPSHKLIWHRLFFVFFLLSLPFSIRKVFTVFSLDGTFNEYLDVSLYLSDVFLLITLFLFIIHNKYSILSIKYWKRMFHVEHLLFPFVIPLFFLAWSELSILWSKSQELALYTFIHILFYYFLYIYILLSNVPRGTNDMFSKCSTWNKSEIQESKMFHVEQIDERRNVPRGTLLLLFVRFVEKCSTWNISRIILLSFIFSGFIQSVIAIFQFTLQKSIGLSFLMESILSPVIPGVAKVIIGNSIFIRSYGLFPHPNVLGGFLAISLLITIFYPLIFKSKMFHVEQIITTDINVPRGTLRATLYSFLNKCSTWNKLTAYFKKMFHVEHSPHTYLYKIVFFVQFIALLLTFSKTALIGLFFGLIIAILNIKKMFHVEQNDKMRNVPRGTFNSIRTDSAHKCSTWNKLTAYFKKMFHVEHLLAVSGIILSILIIIVFNLKLLIEQPFLERLFYMKPLQALFEKYPLEGLGIGQFVYRMQDFFSEKLLEWQLQPIHNVYLLVFSEGGLIGFILFLWFLNFVYRKNKENVPRGTFVDSEQSSAENCSTWNIWNLQISKLFHVEHSEGSFNNQIGVIMSILLNSLLIVIFFIMLFDHYFWDIQQGQLVLWILLALAVSKKY